MSDTVSTLLDERFRTAAAAEGLLDVAYDVLTDTPVGPLLVVGVSARVWCGHQVIIRCCVDNQRSRGGRCGHGRGRPR